MYQSYTSFLRQYFSGNVQKLPVDVGATCPVRDGSLGRGGCAFCNGRSFAPSFCKEPGSVRDQLEAGKKFFRRKVEQAGTVDFLAYFQSGSNTYAPVSAMSVCLEAALEVEGVKGVVIATRPDCLSTAWLEYLQNLARRTFVMVELGVESVNDETLRRIGRGHDFAASRRAVEALAERDIPVCVHLILGLPGDAREAVADVARGISQLPVSVVKLHQLQILKGSRMAEEYARHPERFDLFTPESYAVAVADFLENLRPTIAVERFVSQSPTAELVAPRWGVKPDVVVRAVRSEMLRRGSEQGSALLLE